MKVWNDPSEARILGAEYPWVLTLCGRETAPGGTSCSHRSLRRRVSCADLEPVEACGPPFTPAVSGTGRTPKTPTAPETYRRGNHHHGA
ncbi:MAG: hypothetical protein MZU91_00535 [Desulfosudis oleivorans]|nr:hypothetical protein [Desulfosudis oleivorans]